MKVYLISRPMLAGSGMEDFLKDEDLPIDSVRAWNFASAIVEFAGRLCYMSFGKGRKTNKEFIDNILAQKHFSVLEHANWTFAITGVSRSLTHELVRHRHLSYSQLSQRYVDEKNARFITPSAFTSPEDMEVLSEIQDITQAAYTELVLRLDKRYSTSDMNVTERRKAARQAARAVLPNATETKIVVTGNARAWREFIEKRNTKFADPEIRKLAQEILIRLKIESPELFGDME